MTQSLRRTLLVLACALICGGGLPAAAGAVVVGIGDQGPSVFSDPRFVALHVHESRLIVPWDAALPRHGRALSGAAAWISAARRARITPLVSFGEDGSRIPTVAEYSHAVRAFIHRFPSVRRYTAWNEPDFPYTRLGHDPTLAAAFFNTLVRSCRGCLVIAGDLFMPAAQLRSYLRTYIRGLRFRPAAWALHDYTDVRTHATGQLRVLLSLTRGPVWLDETGGVERRGHWPYPNQSAARAERDEHFLFSLARRYRRISRIYHYQWRAAPWAGWDSALIAANGRLRGAYRVVAAAAR
jgi:hypothetical protein